jgi:hypothetical protein
MKVHLLVAVALLSLLPNTILADGTIGSEDLLRELAKSNPKLVQTLREGFELDADATGNSIGNAINPQLGGTRIGPYTLHGRLRRAAGSEKLVITLMTTITFLDAEGKKTSKVATAASVKEEFKSIQLEVAVSRGKG